MAWTDVIDYQCAFSFATNTGHIKIKTAGYFHDLPNLPTEKYIAMLLTLGHKTVLYDPVTHDIGTREEEPGV